MGWASMNRVLLALWVTSAAAAQKRVRQRRDDDDQPTRAADYTADDSKPCSIYVQNHYGFLWNVVHTIEYVAYHPNLTIYLSWPWSDYQCPGWEGRAWWYWLNSTIVKPHTTATPGCKSRPYSGSPQENPDRFVDWILQTRDGIVKETGLPELTITFGPVTPEQQAVREKYMKQLNYIQRLPEVVSGLWVLSDRLQTLADWEWALLDRLKKPFVGIHIRGGDKHGENVAMWGEDIARQMGDTKLGIEKLIQRHPDAKGGTCVLLGDSSSLAESIAVEAKRLIGCDVINQVPPNMDYSRENFIREHRQELKCLAGTSVFVFIEILARADYTVGSLHNAPYQVASFVRQFKYNKPADTCIDNADFGQPAFLY